MISFARIVRLVPRLLLCLAVLTCVLGLTETAAGVSTYAAAPGVPAAMMTGSGQVRAHDVSMEGRAPSGAYLAGSSKAMAGCPGSCVHSIACAVLAGAAGGAVLLFAPQVAGEAFVAAAAAHRVRWALPSALHPRPPDRAALCVQQV